ncbi:N-acetylmuramoyl-L-alanine amidase [Peptostreptococcaceae bacterium OttesenSCG-928-C18]|nr:N-acetylmuramoyl-L-alanine amidase [Peptostreptococcaceae bacterium OttesenSCG-928-C18]
MKICLDYGHGEKDNRGYLSGTKWKTEGSGNFYYGKMLKAELEKFKDVQIVETRPTINSRKSGLGGTALSKDLANRASYGKGCDLYLSIHSDAFNSTANGSGVFIRNEGSRKLAQLLVNTISSTLGTKNRGVKNYNFAVLGNGNTAPVRILQETAFHTNRSDVTKYEAKAEQLAVNQAKTIASYYGLKLKNTVGTVSDEKPIIPTRSKEYIEGDIDMLSKNTLVIACNKEMFALLPPLIDYAYKLNNGAYEKVVIGQNRKSSFKDVRNCPWRIAVVRKVNEISSHCTYAFVGTDEEVKKQIDEFTKGANRKFHVSEWKK